MNSYKLYYDLLKEMRNAVKQLPLTSFFKNWHKSKSTGTSNELLTYTLSGEIHKPPAWFQIYNLLDEFHLHIYIIFMLNSCPANMMFPCKRFFFNTTTVLV
jgi:hypothetical protein